MCWSAAGTSFSLLLHACIGPCTNPVVAGATNVAHPLLFCVRVLRGGAQVIQLQGDQRKNVLQFLTQEKLVKKEFIKIHGF